MGKVIDICLYYACRARYLLIVLLLSAAYQGNAQIPVILVDITNDNIIGPEYNKTQEDGMKVIERYEEIATGYQAIITGLLVMIHSRERARVEELLSIDDYFTTNQAWKDNFEARMDTARACVEVMKELVDEYPNASSLARVYDKLKRQLDDADNKYNQAMNVKGQENMMRTADRNHLAKLAEEQLEETLIQIYKVATSVPFLRKKIFDDEGGFLKDLQQMVPKI